MLNKCAQVVTSATKVSGDVIEPLTHLAGVILGERHTSLVREVHKYCSFVLLSFETKTIKEMLSMPHARVSHVRPLVESVQASELRSQHVQKLLRALYHQQKPRNI